MVVPDDRTSRLASLQSQVRLHQQQRKQVEVDPALTADVRAMLLAYREKIIGWLREHVAAMESG